jgi:hypothetical protein
LSETVPWIVEVVCACDADKKSTPAAAVKSNARQTLGPIVNFHNTIRRMDSPTMENPL